MILLLVYILLYYVTLINAAYVYLKRKKNTYLNLKMYILSYKLTTQLLLI